jgi:hypothetical protein
LYFNCGKESLAHPAIEPIAQLVGQSLKVWGALTEGLDRWSQAFADDK